MPTLLAVLAQLYLTVFAWTAINGRIPFKSGLLTVVVAWFAGQFFLTTACYFLSCGLARFSTGVLCQAALYCIVVVAGIMCLQVYNWRCKGTTPDIGIPQWQTIVLIAVIFAVSWALFSAQLAYKDGEILRSPAYWDVGYQMLLSQSFVFGDNFPPQTYSYSGVPLAYHFGPLLNISIYSAIGLEFVRAMNLCSTLTFAMLLLGIVGLAEELFGSRPAGILAAVLTLGGSALRFDFLSRIAGSGFYEFGRHIVDSRFAPPAISFLPDRAYGYNGMMFNLFYFIAERQLIFASVYLTVACALLWHYRKMGRKTRMLCGACLALFFQWHLFVTVMVAVMLVSLFLIEERKSRIEILDLLVPFAFVVAIEYWYSTQLVSNEWYRSKYLQNFPRINFNFATMPDTWPLSFLNILGYWAYAYGFKIIIFVAGAVYVSRAYPMGGRLMLALIVPTFVLINTLELSPISIYDNHKWLRPMNIFVDLVCAKFLLMLWARRRILPRFIVIAATVLITLPGAIENTPYFLTSPVKRYALYPTPAIEQIRANSLPQDVFLGTDSETILLAGRKTFTRFDPERNFPPIATDELIRTGLRESWARSIYMAKSFEELCRLVSAAKIKYLERRGLVALLINADSSGMFLPFTIEDGFGRQAVFLDVQAGCALKGLDPGPAKLQASRP